LWTRAPAAGQCFKPERLERTIDIITTAFALPARPAAGDVFDASFLPRAGERAVAR
jgi:hypothetical protein